MSTKEILDILQNSELGKQTKLAIIDILSTSHDEKMLADLTDLLITWHQADVQEQKDFEEKLLAISQAFERRKQQIESSALLAEDRLAHDLETAEKIQALKNQLSS